jgi:hypothetical protein
VEIFVSKYYINIKPQPTIIKLVLINIVRQSVIPVVTKKYDAGV